MSFIKQVFSLPVFSIVLARILYAVNWFNISSIFYLILLDFDQDISMLGLITSGFLIGIGLFQIPAGILAAKYDPRLIIVFGTMLLSVSSLLSGLVSEIYQMVFLRFLVGVGMAFFFGPSVILISKYLGKGSEGFGVGVLNSAHSLGGIIGIFGWIIIAEFTGWRMSLLFSGILGIASGLLLYYTIFRKSNKDDVHNYDQSGKVQEHTLHDPKTPLEKNSDENESISEFQINFGRLRSLMLNRSMLLVALSLLGIQIGWNLISTFIVLYLKFEFDITSVMAGIIGILTLIVNVIFAPFFGKLYDLLTKTKWEKSDIVLLLICGTIISINMILFSFADMSILMPSIVLIGIFASGGFVIPYTMARRIAVEKLKMPNYEILAVSFVNGLSLLGAFWVPFLFSILVKTFNYSTAWIIGGLLTIAFIIPIIKLKY
ncbi:MAG TPA: MFS transporter [Candidatus Nitrosocosmicus sp.]|nr:MFS transporter [Candidatus Nitrosocosmicus sp.]